MHIHALLRMLTKMEKMLHSLHKKIDTLKSTFSEYQPSFFSFPYSNKCSSPILPIL